MSRVYLALYSDGPECGPMPLSIHKTRRGAQAAVDRHKAQQHAAWLEADERYKKQFPWSDKTGIGFDCWGVQPFKVNP